MRRRDFIKGIAGTATTWPLAARAQQSPSKIPVVGVLWHAGSAEEEGAYFEALLQGFSDLGYIAGRNIRFEHRFPNEIPDRFRSFAAELVSLKVDVVVAWGSASAPYARGATTTIPIVFGLFADPVGSRLVASLAAPGGNVTGLTSVSPDLSQKRLQLLKEVVPELSRVALLVNLNERNSLLYLSETTEAAGRLGLDLQRFDVHSLDELNQAFDALDKFGAQGLIPVPSGFMFQHKEIIAKLAVTHHLPTCVWSRETLQVGALISYGPDYVAIARHVAVYVDKILKGANPAELPVEQPTRFQFVVNAKTARSLGITFPPHVLAVADEVIE
jgi:putative tryptophan/tyrosine transport system substrate-binding protein